jgi:hypothetical protein
VLNLSRLVRILSTKFPHQQLGFSGHYLTELSVGL